MKKIIKAMLAVSMITSFMFANTVNIFAQEIQEGTPVRDASQKAAKDLSDLIKGDVNRYFDVYAERTSPNDVVSNPGLRVTKLKSRIYHVDEDTALTPAGFLDDTSNMSRLNNPSSIYFVVGDSEVLMIDGGNGERGDMAFSNGAMKEIVNALVGDKKLTVVVTHSHGDHTGFFNDAESQEILGNVDIYIHKDDYAAVTSQALMNYYTVKSFENGQTLKLGPWKFEIVSVKAHTPGSNAMVNYENEVIFSGDSIGSGTVYTTNLVDYRNSVDGLTEVVKNMDNPIIYAAHRWQQHAVDTSNPRAGGVHANDIAVEEVGTWYVLETQKFIQDIIEDNYDNNPNYIQGPSGAIYSLDSDLNKDGLYPGIWASRLSGVSALQQAFTSDPSTRPQIPTKGVWTRDFTSPSSYVENAVKNSEANDSQVTFKDIIEKTAGEKVDMDVVNNSTINVLYSFDLKGLSLEDDVKFNISTYQIETGTKVYALNYSVDGNWELLEGNVKDGYAVFDYINDFSSVILFTVTDENCFVDLELVKTPEEPTTDNPVQEEPSPDEPTPEKPDSNDPTSSDPTDETLEEVPNDSNVGTNSAENVKTGDNTNIGLWTAMIGLSLVVSARIIIKRKEM